MNWHYFVFLAILFLSVFNFVFKLSSSKISPFCATPILGIVTFLVGLIGFLFSKKFFPENLIVSEAGVWLSILAGIFWGVGQIMVYLMYQKGAPLSVGLPLMLCGLTITSSILGVLILREGVSIFKIVGVFFLLLGFFFLTK